MLLVKDLKTDNRYMLPKEFLNTIPEKCPVCDGDMEIDEGLTDLRCTNAVCASKLTTRMVKLFERMGILGMSAVRCAGIVKQYNATSPYIIFKLCHRDGSYDVFYDYYQIVVKDLNTEPVICEATDKVSVINEFTNFLMNNGLIKDDCKLQHIKLSDNTAKDIVAQVNKARTMLLYEFVRLGNFEGLQETAVQLFKDYTSLDDFYEDLDDGGVAFVKAKLNIDTEQEEDVSIRAEKIYSTLLAAKSELFEYIEYVDLRETQQVLNVCVSTVVGSPFKNKADFIRQMNEKYGDICYLNLLGSVTENCEYMIWAKQGTKTSKVIKAESLDIPILTGTEFDEMMRERFE